jgi:hypothetical protein
MRAIEPFCSQDFSKSLPTLSTEDAWAEYLNDSYQRSFYFSLFYGSGADQPFLCSALSENQKEGAGRLSEPLGCMIQPGRSKPPKSLKRTRFHAENSSS